MFYYLLFRYFGNLKQIPMKKSVKIIGKILYTILAFAPIFALGYMFGLKLL